VGRLFLEASVKFDPRSPFKGEHQDTALKESNGLVHLFRFFLTHPF
jgi:hypothetical protein